MTLSGGRDSDDALRASREARRQREEGYAAKRPWQLPLIVAIAVIVVGGGLFAYLSGWITH